MTRPGAKSRVLRVAVIQSNRIVEDRTFLKPTRITVGQRADNTFILPADGAPRSQTVFDVSRQGYTLVFDEATDGRVLLDGVERPLSELATTSRRLSLSNDARGRVRVGDLSLVFQFVEAPRTHAAPQLPPEVRGGLLAQVDRAFLTVLAVSLGAHFAGAGWLAMQPLPVEHEFSLDDLAVVDRFAAQRAMPLPRPDPVKPVDANRTAPAVTPSRPVAAPRPGTARSPERLREQLAHLGLIGAIGANGGAVIDVLGSNPRVGEVAAALDGASALRVASEGSELGGPRGPAIGATQTIGLVTDVHHEVELAERRLATVPAKVTSGKVEVETSDIPADALNLWLRARTPAIQSCYERELKRNQQLHGRVVLRFSITPRGRVEGLSFEEDSLRNDGVTTCIASLARGWVLPFKPDDDVVVAFPWVFAPAS